MMILEHIFYSLLEKNEEADVNYARKDKNTPNLTNICERLIFLGKKKKVEYANMMPPMVFVLDGIS